MVSFDTYDFARVMDYPADPDAFYVFDFTNGYDPEIITDKDWGIGRYNEKRVDMYETELFEGERNVHMGIDIWAEAGQPVYSFYDGSVVYMRENDNPGDYGPTIIIKYRLNDQDLYALYGHLSCESLQRVSEGEQVQKAQQIATIGTSEVNGGWAPHLHFQLSLEDPGEADMPGVVAEQNREEALEKFPDPRLILGNLY